LAAVKKSAEDEASEALVASVDVDSGALVAV
jgi:hypothetical protein